MPITVSEIFVALQGEGLRAGTRNVFVRFAGCNLKCNRSEHGFDCDTDFASVYKRFENAEELAFECAKLWGEDYNHRAVIFTGGEPLLQLSEEILQAFKKRYFYCAIETNGTIVLKKGVKEHVDWVSCSPKTAEHTIRIAKHVDELRYVRAVNQGIPKPKIKADHYYLSPAAEADGPTWHNFEHCNRLIDDNPLWKLSVQMHKLWGIR